MGFNHWNTHLLASYAKKYPLGDVLTFGRQNISIPAKRKKKISHAHGIDGSVLSGFCEPLLGKLGSSKVTSLDASDHEGCNLILDLSQPISKERWSCYDTILDYGTSEHIFNFPQVLSNVFRFLKKDGVYIFCLPVTGWCDHGLYQFSPNMFTSIAASGYFDLKFLFMQGGNAQRKVYAAKGFMGLRSIELLSYQRISAWGVLIKNNAAELNEDLINIFQTYYLKSWEEGQSTTDNNIKKYTENAQGVLGQINTSTTNEFLKRNIPEKIKQMLWFYKAYHSLGFDDVAKNFNSYKFQDGLSAKK